MYEHAAAVLRGQWALATDSWSSSRTPDSFFVKQGQEPGPSTGGRHLPLHGYSPDVKASNNKQRKQTKESVRYDYKEISWCCQEGPLP